MARRLRSAESPAVLAVLSAVTILSGCQASGPAAPLRSLTSGGQPVLTSGWGAIVPGEVTDKTTYIVSEAARGISIMSVTPIPVRGHPAPVLQHVAMADHNAGVAGADGWPPGVRILPFKGSLLPRGQVNIVYGITGYQAGTDYMMSGLRIRYRYGGTVFTVSAWMAVAACVARRVTNTTDNHCSRVTDAVAYPATVKAATGH